MMLHKLQYISQGEKTEQHYENIYAALDAGVMLVQLRLKDIDLNTYIAEGIRARELCDKYSAKLIINDNPEVALRCNADAVHLGLSDMNVKEAKKWIGNKLIGGTANNLADIEQRCVENVDYIGLGAYRFTTTKKNISSILGLKGYQELMQVMAAKGLNTPVYAIGGLELNDIKDLIACGVYGVAISGAITQASNKEKLIKELNKILYHA